MKLLLLNPKWNISLDNEDINRIDLQNLVKYALEQLINEDSPSVVALKMQMYFHCSFDTSQNIILRHRDNLRNKLIPLENEIITFKPKIEEAETEEELATLFKRMVYYLTLYYGLGDPTETAVSHIILYSYS